MGDAAGRDYSASWVGRLLTAWFCLPAFCPELDVLLRRMSESARNVKLFSRISLARVGRGV